MSAIAIKTYFDVFVRMNKWNKLNLVLSQSLPWLMHVRNRKRCMATVERSFGLLH